MTLDELIAENLSVARQIPYAQELMLENIRHLRAMKAEIATLKGEKE